MKVRNKLITTLLTLTCILGLTACGNKADSLSSFAESKRDVAIQKSLPVIESVLGMSQDGQISEVISEYNNVELGDRFEEVMASNYNGLEIEVEGKAIRTAITSFQSGVETLGQIDMTMFGEPEVSVDDTIIIDYPVKTAQSEGSVELIYSNDIYLVLESCTLNLDQTMGELMGRAGLNTLLGMGTVFCVLILISIIISAFSVIPKIQESFQKKKDTSDKTDTVDPAIAQIIEKEELADDSELVAVIAAAIAAYEGTSSTDGFVVRSVRRAKTNKWNRA